MNLSNLLKSRCKKELNLCTNEEIYIALLNIVNELAEQKTKNESKKKV